MGDVGSLADLYEDQGKLRAEVVKLRSCLRAVLSKVKTVHDKPPGAEERCPNHVNRSQKQLCDALKRGRKALGEKTEE